MSTTTRLSATNYLLIDAGESTDQRQIEKAPDCNRTRPKLMRNNWVHAKLWNAKSEIVVVAGGSSGIRPRVASRLADDGVTMVAVGIAPLSPELRK